MYSVYMYRIARQESVAKKCGAAARFANSPGPITCRPGGHGTLAPLLARIANWKALLESALSAEELKDLRGHSRTGRPLGDETFMDRLASAVGRALKPEGREAKPRQQNRVLCPRNYPTR